MRNVSIKRIVKALFWIFFPIIVLIGLGLSVETFPTLWAQLGLPDAQYELGRMYETGRGKPKDMEEALYWYRKAAARGSWYAQRQLRDINEERAAEAARKEREKEERRAAEAARKRQEEQRRAAEAARKRQAEQERQRQAEREEAIRQLAYGNPCYNMCRSNSYACEARCQGLAGDSKRDCLYLCSQAKKSCDYSCK